MIVTRKLYSKAVGFYVDTTDPPLEVDFIDAITLPEYYDTDLQNFWTNPNNFNDNGEDTTQEKMDNKRNKLMSKYQVRMFSFLLKLFRISQSTVMLVSGI